MKSKKSKYLLLAVAAIVVGSALWYRESQAADLRALTALKKSRPEIALYIDQISALLKKKPGKKELGNYYANLGLAWKSLADRTKNNAYYREALAVYEKGIQASGRKNTLFLFNAGNMAIYLKDYQRARQYYEEAMRAAPGDPEAYIRLANLHKDYLRSSPTVIIAIYDKGIKRMVMAAPLMQEKENYIKSLREQKQ